MSIKFGMAMRISIPSMEFDNNNKHKFCKFKMADGHDTEIVFLIYLDAISVSLREIWTGYAE